MANNKEDLIALAKEQLISALRENTKCVFAVAELENTQNRIVVGLIGEGNDIIDSLKGACMDNPAMFYLMVSVITELKDNPLFLKVEAEYNAIMSQQINKRPEDIN